MENAISTIVYILGFIGVVGLFIKATNRANRKAKEIKEETGAQSATNVPKLIIRRSSINGLLSETSVIVL